MWIPLHVSLTKSSVTIKEAIIILKIPLRHKGKQLGDSTQGSQEAHAVQLVFAVQPPPAELLTRAPPQGRWRGRHDLLSTFMAWLTQPLLQSK